VVFSLRVSRQNCITDSSVPRQVTLHFASSSAREVATLGEGRVASHAPVIKCDPRLTMQCDMEFLLQLYPCVLALLAARSAVCSENCELHHNIDNADHLVSDTTYITRCCQIREKCYTLLLLLLLWGDTVSLWNWVANGPIVHPPHMAQVWNDIDGSKPKDSEKSLFWWLFFHHKSHMDCPGRDPGPSRWEACD
jgi:hypothetical protein